MYNDQMRIRIIEFGTLDVENYTIIKAMYTFFLHPTQIVQNGRPLFWNIYAKQFKWNTFYGIEYKPTFITDI